MGERCEIHPNTTIGSDGYAYALILQRYFDDSRAKFPQDPPIDPRAFVSPEAVIDEALETVGAG